MFYEFVFIIRLCHSIAIAKHFDINRQCKIDIFQIRVSIALFEGCVAAREKAIDARKFEIYQCYCH